MDFISTRSEANRTDAPGAVLQGLAPDGGLFIPREIPSFSMEEIAGMTRMDYPSLAAAASSSSPALIWRMDSV